MKKKLACRNPEMPGIEKEIRAYLLQKELERYADSVIAERERRRYRGLRKYSDNGDGYFPGNPERMT